MTTHLRRRHALAVAAGLAAAAAMTVTLSPPAGATGNGSLPQLPIPPLIRHGAIAVAPDGAAAKSLGYAYRANAENAALQKCGNSGCQLLSSFTRCGAVAHNGSTHQGGTGLTRAMAEADAMTRLGGGQIVIWACN
ncbi:DUF4189 domain-containing protein [Mycobacterium asiaticum]|uniref:DUF4189 domain-containing protein n=1 Tax=Mycobacterium asiaticum TaxID=1790 RepID=UPI0007EFDFE7|nr:DUF4189 domain-containing protein [Mycobacterium asiaticum]OBI96561.1 hypothetical protein A5661_19390 [Mycobacterium asiaticum]